VHALVRELLAVMPADGAAWPRAERERWTAALAAVLDVVYDEDGMPRDPAVPEHVLDLRPVDPPADDEVVQPTARGRHARGGPG
jgi:hypothetical protein